MANEIPTYTQDEYETGFVDFYKPFKLEVADAGESIEEQTGIDVKTVGEQEDKLDTNPAINKLIDPNHNSFDDLKIYSGINFDGAASFQTYEDMIKGMGIDDKAGDFSVGQLAGLATGGSLFSVFGGGTTRGKTLKGPTGEAVFSVGSISEKALKKHYQNFSKVHLAHSQANYGTQVSGFGSLMDNPDLIRKTDLGFAMTIGNNHFSRPPGQMYYDGLKSHLSSEDHNAHMMLKAKEALQYGLDPKGYRLDGKNEDNGGASRDGTVSNGIGRITEDGYFTYVANNSFGYTKSKLYGGSNLSVDLAKNLGVDIDTMIKAMGMARSNPNMTFTQAINSLKDPVDGKTIEQVLAETKAGSQGTITTNLTVPTVTSGAVSDVKGQGIASPMPTGPQIAPEDEGDPSPPATQFDSNFNKQVDQANQQAQDDDNDTGGTGTGTTFDSGFNEKVSGYGPAFQEGGSVEDELVNQASDDQINMQEVGFVNGKTPDQVTETKTVADDVPLDVRDDDFIINAAAIENVGVRNLTNMVRRALRSASQAGVEVVDIPTDIPENQLVKILASEGEFRVPQALRKFIGQSTLDRINDTGKPEVERRSRKLEDEMEELDEKRPQVQQARKGGSISIPLGERFLR